MQLQPAEPFVACTDASCCIYLNLHPQRWMLEQRNDETRAETAFATFDQTAGRHGSLWADTGIG